MSGMFQPLEAKDIECRVAQVNKDNSVNLLLYKTARTDANVLDEVIGQFGWQCEFKEVNGVVYCGIGIQEPTTKEWLWKWDAGSESNVEKEKGQASDAFKRAGFKWGIGRELYTAPRIRVKADKAGVQDGKCFTPFEVETIEYENGEITKLVIKHAWNDDILFLWFASQPNDAPDKFVAPSANDKATEKQVNVILKAYAGKEDKLETLMEKMKLGGDIRNMTVSQAATIIQKLAERGWKA